MPRARKAKLAEVIQLPVMCGDIAGMLRKLADQVEAEEIELDAIVTVLSGPGLLDVRGFGQCDGLQAMAYLALAQQRLCSGTLAAMDGEG
jgi:hypothetical protein